MRTDLSIMIMKLSIPILSGLPNTIDAGISLCYADTIEQDRLADVGDLHDHDEGEEKRQRGAPEIEVSKPYESHGFLISRTSILVVGSPIRLMVPAMRMALAGSGGLNYSRDHGTPLYVDCYILWSDSQGPLKVSRYAQALFQWHLEGSGENDRAKEISGSAAEE